MRSFALHLVHDLHVLGRAVVAAQRVHPVPLELLGLLRHAVLSVGKVALEEGVPLPVAELDAVEVADAAPQVRREPCLGGDLEVLRPLCPEDLDEPGLERGLALVVRLVLGRPLVALQHAGVVGVDEDLVG